MMKLSPVDGRRVRNPDGTLFAETAEVDGSPYWMRRLADGDVEHAKAQKKEPAQ